MNQSRDGDTRGRDIATLTLLVCFLIAVIAHYVAGQYFGYRYPFNTFLYRPADGDLTGPAGPRGLGDHLFGDLYQVWAQTRQESPYRSENPFYESVYPPFAHLALRLISWLAYDVAAVVFLTAGMCVLIWLGYRTLPGTRLARTQAALILVLASYPVLFAMDRGNVDLVVLVLLWLALVPGALAKRAPRWLAPMLLGAAMAFKLYPCLFVIVLLRQRKWRDASIAVASASLLTLAALLSLGGGFRSNAGGFWASLHTFAGFSAVERSDLFVQHSPSIRAGAQAVVSVGLLPAETVDVLSTTALVLGLLTLAAVALLPLQPWQQLYLVATVATTCLAGTHDYRLLLFILPLVARLQEQTDARVCRDSLTVALTMVLVPKSLPVLYGDVTVGVVLNPILIVATAAVIAGIGVRNGLRPAGSDSTAARFRGARRLRTGPPPAGVDDSACTGYRQVP